MAQQGEVASAYAGGDRPALPFENRKGATTEAEVVKGIFGALDSKEQPKGDEDESDGDEQEEVTTSEDEEQEEESSEEEPEQDDSEEDGDEDEDRPSPKLHKLKANGKEEEVTYEELVRRAAAGTDYTRKTQEISTRAKELDTEKGQIAAEREKYVAGIKRVEEVLKAANPEPNWDKLRAEDPDEFAKQWAFYEQHKDAMDRLRGEREKEEAKSREAAEMKHQAFLKEQHAKLLEAFPDLKDKKKGQALVDSIQEYLMSPTFGLSQEELSGFEDHRFWVMADKARKFDELMDKGQKKIGDKLKAAPKVVTPGSSTRGQPTRKAGDRSRMMDRLRKSGKEKDALPLIEQLMGKMD